MSERGGTDRPRLGTALTAALTVPTAVGGLLLALFDHPSLAFKVTIGGVAVAVPVMVLIWHAGFGAGIRWARRALAAREPERTPGSSRRLTG
jgi:hypothetical protein